MSGPTKSGYITGNLWERVLIIAFGSGLLAIGARHFNDPYGGLLNYLRHMAAQVSGGDEDYDPYNFSEVNYSRARMSRDSIFDGGSRSRLKNYSSYDDEEVEDYRYREKRARVIPMPQEVRRAMKSGNLDNLPSGDDVGETNRKELNRLMKDL